MSDSVGKQVLIGTLTALAVAALGWAAGLLPPVWAWLKAAAISVWNYAWTPVSIPLWIVLGVVIALLVWARRGWLRHRAKRERIDPEFAHVLQEPQPSPLEKRVLRALVKADGSRMTMETFGYELSTSRLLIEQALEHLIDIGLVDVTSNYIHGASFHLTRDGRDYAITNGYLHGIS